MLIRDIHHGSMCILSSRWSRRPHKLFSWKTQWLPPLAVMSNIRGNCTEISRRRRLITDRIKVRARVCRHNKHLNKNVKWFKLVEYVFCISLYLALSPSFALPPTPIAHSFLALLQQTVRGAQIYAPMPRAQPQPFNWRRIWDIRPFGGPGSARFCWEPVAYSSIHPAIDICSRCCQLELVAPFFHYIYMCTFILLFFFSPDFCA